LLLFLNGLGIIQNFAKDVIRNLNDMKRLFNYIVFFLKALKEMPKVIKSINKDIKEREKLSDQKTEDLKNLLKAVNGMP